MSDTISQQDRDLDRLDVDEIKRFLARRWKMILAVALGFALLAAIACLAMTPVYTATSQVLLDPHKQHVFGQETINPDSILDSSIVDSQISIITSNRLLAKVIVKEKLDKDPEFAAPTKPGLLSRFLALFQAPRTSSVESESSDGIDPRLAPVILNLFKKVEVTRVAKSYVLSISASSRDSDKAMHLANSLAEAYVADQVDVRARSVQQTATFFEQRLDRLRQQVRQTESAVAEFRKAHNLITTSTMEGKVTVGEQQLQSLNEQLAKVSADTAEKLAMYQQAARFKLNGRDLDSLPEIIRAPVITQLRTQQADLSRREADLSSQYGPAYPAITQIHAQRAGLERAVSAEIRRLTATLKNNYEVAKAREDAFRKTIKTLSEVSGGDNEIGVKLRELERANLANKALFENFLNRAKLAQEQSTFEEPDARLISPALEPTSPSSPKTKIIVPVALVAGLLLGLGLAALLDKRRLAVGKRKPQAAAPPSRDNAFILARIPTIADIDGPGDLADHLESTPDSEFARSIGGLATKLATASAEEGRVVALAPLNKGEGASSLTLCLAESLGRAGRRVLLVDTDRDGGHGNLSKVLKVADQPGLGEVVAGRAAASKTIIRRDRFVFMPVGQEPLPTAGSSVLGDFLKDARGRFEIVLVDAPAFAAGSHAEQIAALADTFALVASWDEMMREPFIAAIDMVADKPGFAGIILNRTTHAQAAPLAVAG